jgi:hypothetical protein
MQNGAKLHNCNTMRETNEQTQKFDFLRIRQQLSLASRFLLNGCSMSLHSRSIVLHTPSIVLNVWQAPLQKRNNRNSPKQKRLSLRLNGKNHSTTTKF